MADTLTFKTQLKRHICDNTIGPLSELVTILTNLQSKIHFNFLVIAQQMNQITQVISAVQTFQNIIRFH